MLSTRVIPCLLLKEYALVKTRKFREYNYVGDPVNAVRIYNECEVDELVVLDITATAEGRKPNFELLKDLADECFMPFAYGGGIQEMADIEKIIACGVEKVVMNYQVFKQPELITKAANYFGSQSIIASMDVKKTFWGKQNAYVLNGQNNTGIDAVEYAKRIEELGAGEIFLNNIDRDGEMNGYDVELIKKVAQAVKIPVIACGGAGKLADLSMAVNEGKASAVAAGSLFVYQGETRGVLINYPGYNALQKVFSFKGE